MLLHNLLIRVEDRVPEQWIDENFSDIDDDERAPPLEDDDELMLPVPANAPSDERRRQLTTYISEVYVP
jgi:hypothetical protein